MQGNNSYNYILILLNNRRKAQTNLHTMEKQVLTMESIKTVEDALNAAAIPATPEFNEVPEEMKDYFKAVYEAVAITKALVQGWKADWNDSNQQKWYPWFKMSSGGFVFDGAYCDSSSADAGNASRLCFPTEEMAEYAGRQFTEVYSRMIQK
jgi:hypothetical protein